MHYESFKNFTSGIQSIATVLALGVGAVWTYQRFIRSRESRSKVDLDVELSFAVKQHTLANNKYKGPDDEKN